MTLKFVWPPVIKSDIRSLRSSAKRDTRRHSQHSLLNWLSSMWNWDTRNNLCLLIKRKTTFFISFEIEYFLDHFPHFSSRQLFLFSQDLPLELNRWVVTKQAQFKFEMVYYSFYELIEFNIRHSKAIYTERKTIGLSQFFH